MKPQNKKLILLIIGALIITGGVYAAYSVITKTQNNQQLVGNDRDEHGCIGSAGYSWCEAKQKCLRVREEKCENPTTTSTVPIIDGQITVTEALKILKGDKKCGNPSSVEEIKITTDIDSIATKVPKGTYWKSSIFTPSDSTAPVSNGCFSECYLDVTNKNKIYYNSGCV